MDRRTHSNLANMNPEDSNPELESFRAQWRAEVQAKHAVPGLSRQPQQLQQTAAGPTTGPHARTTTGPQGKPPQPSQKLPPQELGDDDVLSRSFDELAAASPAPTLTTTQLKAPEKGEPVSALDHYERAVEKEAAGSLGDSLRLYRKAFRVRDGEL